MINEIDNMELMSCVACGSYGFPYEMRYCECGSLVHKDCIVDGKCDGCDRAVMTIEFFDNMVA
jgi:hypothetical protein